MPNSLDKFNEICDAVKSNPHLDPRTAKDLLMSAALEVWNNDIAGEFELQNGQHVTIHTL